MQWHSNYANLIWLVRNEQVNKHKALKTGAEDELNKIRYTTVVRGQVEGIMKGREPRQ